MTRVLQINNVTLGGMICQTKKLSSLMGARTAIGRFGGALRDLTIIDIGVVAVKVALEKSGVNLEQVDEVIIGHARQAGSGPNAARIVSINAGIPATVPAYTVNQACVSGMLSIMLAYQSITLGNSDIALAGGIEHHSSIPLQVV